jgi:hypothetical protein
MDLSFNGIGFGDLLREPSGLRQEKWEASPHPMDGSPPLEDAKDLFFRS